MEKYRKIFVTISVPADKEHEAGAEEAGGGNGEEHEEDGLGGHQVVAAHHESRVVRRVEAGEPAVLL